MANIMLETHDLSFVVHGTRMLEKETAIWAVCWGIRSYYPLTTCVPLAPVSNPSYPSPSCPTCVAPGSPQFCHPHNHELIQVPTLGTIINFYFSSPLAKLSTVLVGLTSSFILSLPPNSTSDDSWQPPHRGSCDGPCETLIGWVR